MADLDFLDMPDDELPEFESVREQIEEADGKEPEEQKSAPAGLSAEEQEQAALEAQVQPEEDDDDEDQGRQIAGEEEPAEEEETPGEDEGGEANEKEAPAESEVTDADKSEASEQEKETKEVATPDADVVKFRDTILAPFKANGREIQVKNAEEAQRLIQMGANYNQKMQALKPHLALLRQLEDADLASPEAVGQILDLLKHKKPEAIAALAKSAGVDPLDIDEKKVEGYKPQAVQIDPVAEAMSDALDSIQHSQHYTRVVNTAKAFDSQSKKWLSENPAILGYMESQMSNGVFDIIDAEVNRRKVLDPRVSNAPYLQVYQQVGEELQKQGAFAAIEQAAANAQVVKTPAAPVKVTTAGAKPASAAVNARKRAAAPTSSSTPRKTQANYNPLDMSDEEFEKHLAQHFKYIH